MQTTELTEANIGCWLDSHRGHYIGRDAIQLAQELGFIVDQFEQFAIDAYDAFNFEDNYPHEGMHDLCDKAVQWLNSGQTPCPHCGGMGGVPDEGIAWWTDKDGDVRCRPCSGTGRSDRIAGQGFPPKLPEVEERHVLWGFEDGDFGIWLYDEEGELADF